MRTVTMMPYKNGATFTLSIYERSERFPTGQQAVGHIFTQHNPDGQ